MKKISSFVLAASMTVAATGAFAGGMADPIVEPAPVVVDGGSSSAVPLWLPLLGGAAVVAALVSNDSSSTTATE